MMTEERLELVTQKLIVYAEKLFEFESSEIALSAMVVAFSFIIDENISIEERQEYIESLPTQIKSVLESWK